MPKQYDQDYMDRVRAGRVQNPGFRGFSKLEQESEDNARVETARARADAKVGKDIELPSVKGLKAYKPK